MVKLIAVYGRNQTLTRKQFLERQRSLLQDKECRVVQSIIYTREENISLNESHCVNLTGKDGLTELWLEWGEEKAAVSRLFALGKDELCLLDEETLWSMVAEELIVLEQEQFAGKEKLVLFFKLTETLDVPGLKLLWQDVRQGFLQALSDLGIGKVVEHYAVPEFETKQNGRFQFAVELYCSDLAEILHIAQSGELRFALLACRQWFSEVTIFLAKELEVDCGEGN